MANWEYTIKSGSALHEAINNDDLGQTVKCLLLCYQELLNQLDDSDREYYEVDIQDSIGVLMAYELCPDDDEDFVNDLLAEFYDICDELRAWIEI